MKETKSVGGRRIRYFFKRWNRILIGGAVLLSLILVSVFAPVLTSYHPEKTDVYHQAARPSPEHPLGTDLLGRDALARVLYGGRISLLVGLGVGVFAMVIGVALGLLSGYYRRLDKILMRVMDGISAFPSVLLALLLLSITEGGTWVVIIALSVSAIPGIARLTRSSALSIREQEHVEAARAMGAGDIRIMFQYILPLCTSPLLIRFTTTTAGAILSESTLSFLGIGVPATIPTWGNMLNEGRRFLLTAPHLLYAPGIAIILTVISVNMIGDGLRDILDSRLK